MRGFMWEGVDEGRSAHLVIWDFMEKSVNLGVLELENLRTQNMVFIHSSGCLVKAKETSRNPWEDFSIELPPFPSLV